MSHKPSCSRTSSITSVNDAQLEYIFHPPHDILCPITRQLFVDPVVNSVGQVYEREAILEYISKSEEKKDPITRQPINPTVFTPIYSVKARALEYREHVASLCVDLACKKDSLDPVTYLKRAAELCGDVAIQVCGLSQNLIKAIMRHAGNSGYNVPILMSFAEELLEDGQRERAASVYYNLLKFGEDKSCQPEVLKRCIECWAGSMSETEKYSLEKLVDFIQHQDAFSWEHIIDIMHRGDISEKLCLRVCEELLLHSVQKNSNDSLWVQHQGVLIRYIAIQYQQLARQQALTQKDIAKLQEWKERSLRSGGPLRHRSLPFAVIKERRKPFFLRKKFIGCALLGALTFIDDKKKKGIQFGKALAFLLIAHSL